MYFSDINELSSSSIDPQPVSGVLVFRESKPFEIACFPPKALPPALVWWEDQFGKVLTSRDTNPSLLVFGSPKADSDSGNYTCYAKNMAGVKSVGLQLIVSGIISFFSYFFFVDLNSGR